MSKCKDCRCNYYVKGDTKHFVRFCPPHAKMIELWTDVMNTLRFIAKGEGAFSRDPLEHATNIIVDMKLAAQHMLARCDDTPKPDAQLIAEDAQLIAEVETEKFVNGLARDAGIEVSDD